MRKVAVLALAAVCSGCATTETVQFRANPQQQALVRDGQPALVSRAKNSIVLVRPASREFAANARPSFVIGINNMGRGPADFRVSDIEVSQNVNGHLASLQVITYEQLVDEERTRQVAAAVLTGLAAGVNTYSASRAGYYRSNSTVVTPRGNVYNVSTTGYSPTAAAIAQSNANAQNEAMIGATIEQGQQNLAALERSVIKDNTLMPGEWYGGQLQIQPLVSAEGPRTYKIALMVGSERHEVEVVQSAAR